VRHARDAPSGRALRWGLAALLAFGALNAFGGGWYGMAGAEGVPLDWLDGTPFADYFVPSLILFVVVGGSLLGAAVGVAAGVRRRRELALAASVVVLGWLAVQVALIGYVSWMQPATAAGAALALVLAARLRA